MARMSDIATGDTVKLMEQTEGQRRIERMNLAREVKKGRKLVGSASDMAGAKFVAKSLHNVRYFPRGKGSTFVIEVWASFGFISCTFDQSEAERMVGLAYGRFEQVNIIENRSKTGTATIFEVWGIL